MISEWIAPIIAWVLVIALAVAVVGAMLAE